MIFRAILIVAPLAFAACHGGTSTGAEPVSSDAADANAPPPSPTAPPVDEPPIAAPSATLTLLSPGRPPRRQLRYAWRADQREELTIDLRTVAASAASPSFARPPAAIDADGGDAHAPSQGLNIPPAPPIRIVVDIDPTGVSAEEELRYTWRVVSAGTSPAPGTNAQVAEGMRDEVSPIEHLSGTGHVSSRGLGADVAIDPASLGDGGLAGTMVEQVQQTLREVAAPFPEEEVGLGARWQKISQLAAKDARVTQTETFTLRDLKGNGGTLDDALAQTAGGPNAIPGAQARIESMLVSASAKTRFDETRLVPQTRFESTTTMVLSAASPSDKTGPVTMVLRVEILLAGAVR